MQQWNAASILCKAKIFTKELITGMSKTEECIFQIISNSGSAKSHVFEALRASRAGDFESAVSLLESADEELKKAHGVQTELLQEEAAGNMKDVSLLMIHAQDHLMSSMLARDFSNEIIALSKELFQIKKERKES